MRHIPLNFFTTFQLNEQITLPGAVQLDKTDDEITKHIGCLTPLRTTRGLKSLALFAIDANSNARVHLHGRSAYHVDTRLCIHTRINSYQAIFEAAEPFSGCAAPIPLPPLRSPRQGAHLAIRGHPLACRPIQIDAPQRAREVAYLGAWFVGLFVFL
ncbi:MAG: hypothetical protein KGL42_00345 [Betaproteobacteria bacterium]|nr:hypothetical protein [Betaproteobacteria bacterium]